MGRYSNPADSSCAIFCRWFSSLFGLLSQNLKKEMGCGASKVHPLRDLSHLSALDERLMEALLSGAIKLLRSDFLIGESCGKKIMRRRDYEQLEQQLGEHKVFLPPHEAAKVLETNKRAVGALTYGWTAHDDPDVTGGYLSSLQHFLKCKHGAHVKAVFWDYPSLPEK